MDFCEIFKNTIFYRTTPVATSVKNLLLLVLMRLRNLLVSFLCIVVPFLTYINELLQYEKMIILLISSPKFHVLYREVQYYEKRWICASNDFLITLYTDNFFQKKIHQSVNFFRPNNLHNSFQLLWLF